MDSYEIKLTKRLIALHTTADNMPALREAIDLVASELAPFTIERFESNGYPSLLAYNTLKRPKRFKVLLNGHIDVIPARDEQFIPQVRGARLYGAGAMDMKASIACLVAVFQAVAPQVDYPLGLQIVSDEETGGYHGTKYQVQDGIRADFILAAEPTNFDIVYKAKGVTMLNISFRGKAAHGAYPWRGANAIEAAITFINRLQKRYPNPKREQWVTTVNVSRIETSNIAFNKVPDECTVSLDIRTIARDYDTCLASIRKMLPPRATLTVFAHEPSLDSSPKNEFIRTLGKAYAQIFKASTKLRGANGTSDARYYQKVGGVGIEFGPKGGGIGSDNEWVDIPNLDKYHQVLKAFLLSFSSDNQKNLQ